ncbi:MAG: sigma-70 family RNA polymerase sigma factor [Chloroflexaceae bacterium]|nr:sigma-70 family RNA polymerase sigma factor [Chloroflexaceae bacterium]
MFSSQQRGDTSQQSDETLMAMVATGDRLALEQLYDRYARTVYGLALRMLANAEHAEDVVQETFWRVWRRGATFQAGQGQFAGWLFGIAHNLCIDDLRRRRVRPTVVYEGQDPTLLHELPDGQQDVDTLTWQNEQRRLIVEALRDLPHDQRQVIELAYFSGLSQREIAEHLQDPLGTVKTRARLALQKLKHLLQAQGIGLEDR